MEYTAVFAVSDYYAIELISFLQERGIKVPEEISVAGFDDCPLSGKIYPALTTIRQDGKRRAEMAVAVLRKLKAGDTKSEGKTYTLPVELVRRQSVKAVNET
ncbi:MAG: substrate-binding domain-containing protein, partial [Lachnospiraceae bacterium]|nr:substrate-binding domain-containing protein [Lachnospiraceae bacterium]